MRKQMLLVLSFVILATFGCDGSDSRKAQEAPDVDLTGQWTVTEGECSINVMFLGFVEDLEAEQWTSPDIDIEQMGSLLNVTDLETGTQSEATISGDQIRYSFSESNMIGTMMVDIHGEVKGTVVNEDLIIGTQYAESTINGQTFSVECTGQYERV